MKIFAEVLLVLSIVGSSSYGFTEIDGERVAKDANKIIGTKYVWGGNSNTKGLDCSALVKNVYKKYGYHIPRKASWQVKDTKYCPTYTELGETKIGDALYFKNRKKGIHHTAIVTGFSKNGTPIITHAKGKDYGVVRELMSERYKKELCGIKRFHECSSSLAGVHTEKEIAEHIILASKKYGVKPEILYNAVWQISKLDPLLISIDKNKNQEMDMNALLRLSGEEFDVEYKNGIVTIGSRNIQKAKTIISGLYENGYNFSVGLMQVEIDHLSYSEVIGLVYPQQNFKHVNKKKFKKCIDSSDIKYCYLYGK